MAITIIGIPLALANLKLIPVSLVPLGKGDRARRPGAFPLRSAQGRRMTGHRTRRAFGAAPRPGDAHRGTDGRYLRPRRLPICECR
jgi:hypothetical protein